MHGSLGKYLIIDVLWLWDFIQMNVPVLRGSKLFSSTMAVSQVRGLLSFVSVRFFRISRRSKGNICRVLSTNVSLHLMSSLLAASCLIASAASFVKDTQHHLAHPPFSSFFLQF